MSETSIFYDRDTSKDLIYDEETGQYRSANQYFSKFSDGTNTYIVKDAEARSSLANKQDTLVSGTNIKTINNTSILGSGNISISTGDYDNETITKNGSNELQTVAIVNPNTNSGAISPLKIWNGTQTQWTNGEATVWNYWQTEITTLWENSGSLPNSEMTNITGLGYANGRFILAKNNETYYTDDYGNTWTKGGNIDSTSRGYNIFGGNNNFIALISGHAYCSTDGGLTWNSISTENGRATNAVYSNGRFTVVGSPQNLSNHASFSTDDGVTWQSCGNFPMSSDWCDIAYGNGRFIAITSNNGNIAYSSDNGSTWQLNSSFNFSGSKYISFGNNIFIITHREGNGKFVVSTDDGITWQYSDTLPYSGLYSKIQYSNGIFLGILKNSTHTIYSTDGIHWFSIDLPFTSSNVPCLACDDEKFITANLTSSAIFQSGYDKCYTLDSTPTTSSQVYSEPEITSTKTITSVGSETITLSDNLVYTYTPSGNRNIYRTLGVAHPDWLCNINNVGVKIGNTTIATAGSDSILPSQTGQSGKYLTTDGATASWGAIDVLPSQSGNNGKFLSTNGTTASWTTVTMPTVDQTYNASSANAQSGTAVASAISSAISSVYKPAGSVVFANLPTPSASNEGNVYNVTNAFTTTSSFVEGAGINYPAGTNVVIINTGSNTYKFDTLTGAFQPLLVSGTNIKTINSNSILGSGNLDIDALPSQTNNSGKFLTTNGTTASWGNVTIPYGESTSAADAVQKEVTISEITELKTGQIIIVKPTITSTVADSTLKLNNFTAYPILYGAAAITTSTDSITWAANYPSWFRFDGSNWVFLGHGVDNNTTYSAMSVAEGTTGTKTTARSVRADYLKQIIQGTKLTGLSTSTNSAVVATDTILVAIGKLQAQIGDIETTINTIRGV